MSGESSVLGESGLRIWIAPGIIQNLALFSLAMAV